MKVIHGWPIFTKIPVGYPMVFMIIIPFFNGYFIGKINPIFYTKNVGLSESMADQFLPIYTCWEYHL